MPAAWPPAAQRVLLAGAAALLAFTLFAAQRAARTPLESPVPDDPALGVRIDLNAAAAAELEALPGIGAALPARIVAEREARGGFRGVLKGTVRVTMSAAVAASRFAMACTVTDPTPRSATTGRAGTARPPSRPAPRPALCAGVHHPNNDEMRITFSDQPTITSSWGGTPPPTPGDGSHIWVHWDDDPPYFPSPPGVTEQGSSGSPFYDQNRRFIGQLHGGASACGATGDDLSDIYGRLSVSWTGGGGNATRVSNWLDPGNTGVMTLDGVDLCTPPDPPANPAAAPNGDNRIDVSWDTVPGAETYRVFRSFGACPGTSWALLADDLTSTSYSDLAVLGGSTYAYQMTAVDADQPCESVLSACVDATATGSCPVPDPSTLTSPANGATNVPVRPAFAWTASSRRPS